MNIDRLVDMANDISNFFDAEPDKANATAEVASHLRRYWEKRMRAQIIVHLETNDGEGLSDLAKAAVRKLADEARENAA